MIDRSQLYIVANESYSPLVVSTKTDSIKIDGATSGSPTTIPLTYEDIIYINSTSNAFKIGLLFFEEEYSEDWYKVLKIHNWRDILHDSEIEQILLHPTKESMERILKIQNPQYFERIRGVFIGMKNAGIDVSSKVEGIIRERYFEFLRKKYTTNISLRDANDTDATSDNKMLELQKQIDALQAQIARITTLNVPITASANSEVVTNKPKETNIKAKSTTSKEKATSGDIEDKPKTSKEKTSKSKTTIAKSATPAE